MGHTDESTGLYEGSSPAQLTAKKVIVTFVLTEFTQGDNKVTVRWRVIYERRKVGSVQNWGREL
jgi:hypothetical protein